MTAVEIGLVAVGSLLATAQVSGQAKMLLIYGQSVAVTDYSSMAQCEAARRAIQTQIAEQNARLPPPRPTPGGGAVLTLPVGTPQMFCIPR